jgi:hypothetical protein
MTRSRIGIGFARQAASARSTVPVGDSTISPSWSNHSAAARTSSAAHAVADCGRLSGWAAPSPTGGCPVQPGLFGAQRPSTKTPIPVESRKVRACRSMTTCDGLPVALHAAFAAPFAPARVVPDRGDLRRAVGAGQGLRRDHGSAGGPCGVPRGLRRAAGRAGRMSATRSRPRAAVLPRSWT